MFIGVDLGTSGVRAMAIDADGRVLASAKRPLPAPDGMAPRHEQNPELWWAACLDILRELSTTLAPNFPRRIAVDGTSATLLMCDLSGRPLCNALMYNDARARRQADAISVLAPAQSGAHGASSSLAKLMWLREEHFAGNPPENAHAIHQAEWIAGRLCGDYTSGDENNQLKLGYNPLARRWPAWMEPLDLAPYLARRVLAPGSDLAPLRGDLARELGWPEDVMIRAGTTDSTAAFLAAGASRPGEAVTSLGSTLVMKILSEQPVFSPRHGVYSHRLGRLWLVGGASNSGGKVLRQFFSNERLRELTPRLRPTVATGLDYYPLPAPGERFPISDPGLAPRMSPRPDDDAVFLQALFEGMARIEAEGYRLLETLGAPRVTSVRSCGGGAANPAWRAIRAAALDAPLIDAAHQQAAYGAALLARDGVNGGDLENTSPPDTLG